MMSHASSLSLKRKRKRNSKRKEIQNQEKIDKRKRKILVSPRSITISEFGYWDPLKFIFGVSIL